MVAPQGRPKVHSWVGLEAAGKGTTVRREGQTVSQEARSVPWKSPRQSRLCHG